MRENGKERLNIQKTDCMMGSRNGRGRRSCRPKHFTRAATAASLHVDEEQRCLCQLQKERKEEKKKTKSQQCHVLLHHWIGLEDSGPTSDEGSHMPLGCVPFCRAQLASTHPCNYLYSICVQRIVQGMVAVRNYVENHKTAALTTVICNLQEAASFPFEGQVKSVVLNRETNHCPLFHCQHQ